MFSKKSSIYRSSQNASSSGNDQRTGAQEFELIPGYESLQSVLIFRIHQDVLKEMKKMRGYSVCGVIWTFF